MKTPREILLARHRAAEPKLDQIRADTLAQLATRPELKRPREQKFEAREIFPSLRLAFGFVRVLRPNVVGLGGVWLVILLFKLATPASSSGNFVRTPISPLAMQSALAEQQRLLAELNEDVESKIRKATPKTDATRPRSERQHPHASA